MKRHTAFTDRQVPWNRQLKATRKPIILQIIQKHKIINKQALKGIIVLKIMFNKQVHTIMH